MAVADGDVAQSAGERNAGARRAGGGGGNGVTVQIQRHAVGGDVNAIARADGEIVRQIIRAGLGERHQAGRVGDGRAGLDLIQRLHHRRGHTGRAGVVVVHVGPARLPAGHQRPSG